MGCSSMDHEKEKKPWSVTEHSQSRSMLNYGSYPLGPCPVRLTNHVLWGNIQLYSVSSRAISSHNWLATPLKDLKHLIHFTSSGIPHGVLGASMRCSICQTVRVIPEAKWRSWLTKLKRLFLNWMGCSECQALKVLLSIDRSGCQAIAVTWDAKSHGDSKS